MTFETERCLIRFFQEADLDDFMAYRNRMDWMRFQGFKGLSREAYREALFGAVNALAGYQLAVIAKADGRLVGDLYLRREGGAYWIGYTVAPRFARQGYASEAVAGLLVRLAQDGVAQARAEVEPENVASVRLLEKLGFQPAGITEDGELLFTFALAEAGNPDPAKPMQG